MIKNTRNTEILKEVRLLDIIGSEPSFDILEFIERIGISEDWAKLIVSQIYLDHIITATINDQLPNAETYLSGRKSFNDKLSLCNALGYFTEHVGDAIRAINRCRNKFAHQLIFEVNDTDKQSIFHVLKSQRSAQDLDKQDGFSNLLLSVVMTAEAERVLQKRKSQINRELEVLMDELFERLSANPDILNLRATRK